MYTGTRREDAFTALLKQADKKRKGSPRFYTTMLPGTTSAYGAAAWSKALDANGDLPQHDQLWQPGRPLTLLPQARRAQAAQAAATPASATAPQAAPTATPAQQAVTPEQPSAPVVAPVPAATTPVPVAAPATPYPMGVMLCEPAKDLAISDDVARIRAMAEPFLSNPTWIATRKVEGRRAQIHVVAGGEVITEKNPLHAAGFEPVGLGGLLAGFSQDATDGSTFRRVSSSSGARLRSSAHGPPHPCVYCPPCKIDHD